MLIILNNRSGGPRDALTTLLQDLIHRPVKTAYDKPAKKAPRPGVTGMGRRFDHLKHVRGRDAGGEHRSADKRPPQGASREKVAFGRLRFARQEKSGGGNYGEIDGNNELIQAGQSS
jgi:hypothetical protein